MCVRIWNSVGRAAEASCTQACGVLCGLDWCSLVGRRVFVRGDPSTPTLLDGYK